MKDKMKEEMVSNVNALLSSTKHLIKNVTSCNKNIACVSKKKGMAEYITKKKSNKVLLTRPFRNFPCQSPLQEFPLPFLLT